MTCKLIAVDIDGTLLNSNGRLTSRTVTAVKEAINKGTYFVLSTGRPLIGVKKISEELGLKDMPFILYNGAMVTMGGKAVYSLTVPEEIALKVIEEGHKRGTTMICWANGDLYAESLSEKVEFYRSISGATPIIVDTLAKAAPLGITKFVWYDDKDTTDRYYKEMTDLLGDKLNVHPSRVDFLEFVNKKCSKATALEYICKMLSVKREECAAIGDGINDLPMLEYAGISVAMGNADNRVKEKCRFITSSCDEDGVAEFIEESILG